VTGNSMGWYSALACAGALSPENGFDLVNTMGTLMQERLIGGQLIYPFVDEDWPRPGAQGRAAGAGGRDRRPRGHALALSIDLGGMLVLAGNEAGLAAFESGSAHLRGAFPMRLANHAAFHTALQAPVPSGRAWRNVPPRAAASWCACSARSCAPPRTISACW
jgi:[acyl-carrier-protein] S-malonyltransferase